MSQPALAQTTPQAPCTLADIDRDNDGLIEICDLEGLSAIRHQLDGSGYKAGRSATKITAGCAEGGCKGYELDKNLDFDDDASYSNVANKVTWTTGSGWQPIGASFSNFFGSTFDGNGHTISNLMINRFLINRSRVNNVGLFGYTNTDAEIINIGLPDVDILGFKNVGGLVGFNRDSNITDSYMTGSVKGDSFVGGLVGFNSQNNNITNSYATGSVKGDYSFVGGLAGYNEGTITNSYATGSVKGGDYTGGLVGLNRDSNITNSYATSSVDGRTNVGGLAGFNFLGSITNSYATGAVKASWYPFNSAVGGLVGDGQGSRIMNNSYWDKTTSGMSRSHGGVGKTTTELQSPIGATGIYSSWSTSSWSFGTRGQYPALKYSDGTLMPNQGREILEEPPQMSQIEIAGVPTGAVNEGESITLPASSASSASSIPLIYQWKQTLGKTLLINPTSGNTVILDVPEDYVAARTNIGNVVLTLRVSNDVDSNTYQVSITIAKRNNGGIAALGIPNLNERELTAPSIDISGDPDGGGNNIGYQWQIRESTQTAWVNVPVAGTNERYTIPVATAGIVQYRVVVSYTDGQGYREEVISGVVIYETGIEIADLTSCDTADIDQDDDGLIEICDLEGLNAMRHQLDGSSYRVNGSATKITAGCAESGCKGYELSKDLDFDNDASYSNVANKVTWTTGSGWQPIGTSSNPFNATFKANKHSISNLMIARYSLNQVGLFKRTGNQARIEGVGLIDADVRGDGGVGGLVGYNGGTIINSYVIGVVRGDDSIGGLVGDNFGPITNSYTNVEMSGDSWVGGIVGCNFSGGIVTNSYTAPRINRSSSRAGGLLGADSGGRLPVNSYWDKEVSGISSGDYGVGLTTEELQSPTTTTGIYSRWSTNNWDFGTSEQYPALKHSDGTLMPDQVRERPEEPAQMPRIEIAGVPVGAVNEGESITLTASSTSSASSISLIYQWQQTSGKTLLTSPTSGSSVTLDVPEDYVAASENTGNVVLMLEAINDVGSTDQQVSITIAKRNNGGIAALDAPVLNERELTASSIDLSGDPDGVGSTIGYQWQIRQSTQTAWINVQTAGTNALYTIPAGITGIVQYRVVMSYTDGQGYGEEVVSEAVIYERRVAPQPSIDIASLTSCGTADIDQDDDGLIEICDLEGLNAMRYQLNGSGYRASWSATKITAGCAESGCRGYELSKDLDFNDEASYSSTPNKVIWTTGSGWEPIGVRNSDFESTFDGNGYTISNLMVNRATVNGIGLFGHTKAGTEIANIGLLDVDIQGDYYVGGLVGFNKYSSITNSYATGNVEGEDVVGGLVGFNNYSSITNSYATGSVKGDDYVGGLVGNVDGPSSITNSYVTGSVKGDGYVGGLVGENSGSITNSYATGNVEGDNNVGGLVGVGYGNSITNSYATGSVTGSSYVGGLVGSHYSGTITKSYWDKTTSRILSGNDGVGKTTTELQSPTGATGIYSSWSTSSWDFGTREQYPALKYSDGTLMPNQVRERPEEPAQEPQIEIAGMPTGAVNEGESITLTASSTSSASSIPLIYQWQQTLGKTLLTSPTSGSRVTLDVPEDYVVASDNTGNVVLILEASNDVGSTAHQVLITIAKSNNGGIAALGVPSLNERELTAPSIDLSGDPDGGGNNIGYQWQIRESTQTAWINVPAAGTNALYTIPADITGIVQYRVVVSYTDGQGYGEEVLSGAVLYERRVAPQPSIEIASLTSCSAIDIDQDDDGLIEICNLEGLNAIRHQLDGSGYKVRASATKITTGCAESGCRGYELNKDLDFNDDDSYSSTSNKVIWTKGSGWQPIGYYESYNSANNKPFKATFDGNGYTISNLMVNRPTVNSIGLFGYTEAGARIVNVGLLDVDIRGKQGVGGLVGLNKYTNITKSYATGNVEGNEKVGGLVGENWDSSITKSYATGSVEGNEKVGGLVGYIRYGDITNSYATSSVGGHAWLGGLVGINRLGDITNSYATGPVTGRMWLGGLAGGNSGSITKSYWDKTNNKMSSSDGGVGKTTTELQSPIRATGIYSSWSTSSWDFGTSEQYPALKYSDGTLMPNQRREIPEGSLQIEIAGVPTGAVGEGENITLTASSTSNASSNPLIYQWHQTSGKTLLTSPTSGSSVTLNVPEDYVAAGENTGNVVLMLEAINDVGSTTQQVSIIITKRNNGGVAALGVPNLNERELTAPSIDISGDPDGSGSNVRYQWQIRQSLQPWVNVQTAGTNALYTIPADAAGIVQYRVVMSYTDGQGYGEEVVSGAVIYETGIEIASLTSCSAADIDQDDNGLIEICDLEGLNAMRHQLDGSGYRTSWSATKITAGCAEGGCKGYELSKDLDFDDDASYSNVANKATWTAGSGWHPIGVRNSGFESTFDGNGYTISNLMINRPDANHIGLFGHTKAGTRIANVGLLDVGIQGDYYVGGLVGFNKYSSITDSYAAGSVKGEDVVGGLVGYNSDSSITNSYVTGSVKGDDYVGGLVGNGDGSGSITNSYAIGSVKGDVYVGGLVGDDSTSITNSYAMGNVEGDNNVGGLVGVGYSSSITNSYATGSVTGSSYVGGLISSHYYGTITKSYWDKTTSAILSGNDGVGKTTTELQSPTTSTGIYSSWSTKDWDFGTSEQYPALKYSDGTLMPNQGRERPEELPQIEIAGVPTSAVNEGERITLTVSSTSSASSIPLVYHWQQTSGKTLLTSPTSRSSVTLNVPEDYVVVGENTGNVELILEAINDVGSTTQQVSITITKRNNGGIATLGVPTLNERELTAPAIDISGDPDGGGNNIGYQWQIRESTQTAWVNVPAAGTNERYTIPADTAGIVQYRVVVSYTDGQGYEEEIESEASIYEGNTIPSVEIAGVPAGTVDEGERITLTASSTSNASSVALIYHWQQTSGKTLLISPTSGSSVTLDVPEDYVVASENTGNVVLILEASNDVGSTAQQVLITITKRNNGGIAALGVPNLNERELTAPSIDLSGDPDGSGNNIRYQWQIRQSTQTAWVNVLAAGTNERYTIPADIWQIMQSTQTAGRNERYPIPADITSIVEYRVVVSYTDGQGYEEQIASEALSYEGKTILSIEIAGVPADAVDEGERITLTAYSTSSASSILLIHQWRQISGEVLFIEHTAINSVTLNIPEDYVAARSNTSNVELTLEISNLGISNNLGNATYQVSITVAKRNNGGILALGVPSLNERGLTAPSIDLSGDPDGSGSNIRYQWQVRQSAQAAWVNVQTAGTNALYTIPADITGIVEYRVVVSYTDGQGYEEEVMSEAVIYETGTELADLTSCGTADIDQDDDGLIEICDLEGLSAIRHQLDGSGYKASRSATKITAGCAEGGCKGYELDKDLDFDDDASYSSTPNKVIWTTGSGWQPIGYYESYYSANNKPFKAIFEGNNYTISNLMINSSNVRGVGLFSHTKRGTIMNVGLLNVDIQGHDFVGGLVGFNRDSSITNSYATGSVEGNSEVGGLVGYNHGGTIRNSHATSSVEGRTYVGGLVGDNTGGTVRNSYATSSVEDGGTVRNSYATGAVKGEDRVGGLTGSSADGDITDSYATGAVKGNDEVGGLTGSNFRSDITNSYAMGSVEGRHRVGGLVGLSGFGSYYSRPTITNSYATGAVEGEDSVGGLAGLNGDTNITNSYATGAVEGNDCVGGLVGGNRYRIITNSYATGSVEGNSEVGGLVGSNYRGTIRNSYWDKTTSKMSNSDGGVGKTTTELQSPTVATGIYGRWSTNAWDFGTSVQYPALKYSDGTLMPNQRREIPEEPAQMPQIEIVGVPTGAVDEGESITLTASSTSSASSIPLIYQWQQTSGKTLLPNPTSRSSVTLDVPEDYVVASENIGNVVLILEASNDVGSTAQQVLITIAKSNNGGIAALGVPTLNERELTAPSIDISSDPDGGGNNIRYQWQIRQSTQTAWVDVQAAGTNERYTIPADITGIVQYRVVVSYTDGQGYEEEVMSEAVIYERIIVPQPSIDIASLTSCGTADIDQDDDGLIEICNLEGLNAIRYQPDGSGYKVSASATRITAGCAEGGCKGYELEKDLDFNDDDSYSSTPNKVIWTTGEGWLPIGIIDMDPFSCEFRGNDHTISNLMIKMPRSAYIGLFFMTDEEAIIDGVNLNKVDIVGRREVGALVGKNVGGTIRNINLHGDSNTTSTIVGTRSQVGGLVGVNERGTIRNIQLDRVSIKGGGSQVGGLVGVNERGTIRNIQLDRVSIKGGGSQVGGLVGMNEEGIIINSRVSGDSDAITNRVKGERTRIGGLVGENEGGRIINSYAAANIQGRETGRAIGYHVGGLIGYNIGQIMNSYADGSVAANGHVGGLVGNHAGGKIINSYATGSVKGNNDVGGLVGLFGYNHQGDITNSYATGSVEGNDRVGGLVGLNSSGNIIHSYWDKTTSKMLSSDGGVGKTTTKLQSPITPGSTSTEIYYGWSTNDWDFGTNEQYPALKYSDGTLMPNQVREIPEEPAQMPQIEIAGVPTGAVNEGERITLTASSASSASSIPLIYQWQQTSGKTLLTNPTSGSSVTLNVPEDYVVASENIGNVVLILEASNDVGSTAQQVLITIAKSNNGGIAALDIPNLNERELTAPSIDISGDPDGSGNNIRYQWQIRQSTQTAWVDVQAAGTNERYTIPADITGIVQYRVVVSYTDGQGYEEEVMSEAVIYERIIVPQPSIDIASLTSCGTADIDQDDDGLIEICNLEGLNAMRYQPDGSGYKVSASATKINVGCAEGGCKGYELSKDLDFNDDASYSSTSNKVIWTTGEGWLPIGITNRRNSLSCEFNGNNYTISNLMIKRQESAYIGLFAMINNSARIESVNLNKVDIVGRKLVGALVGKNIGGTIRNIQLDGNSSTTSIVVGMESQVGGLVGMNAEGSVIDNVDLDRVSIKGGNQVGGLVGMSKKSTIRNINVRGDSSTTSTIVGTEDEVGGLVGMNAGGSVIDNVDLYKVSIKGRNQVGGLAGTNKGIIINSRVSGDSDAITNRVKGEGDIIGGLVGMNQRGRIINSHAVANVQGKKIIGVIIGQYVGGLVGYNTGQIINSYADGSVVAGGNVGGLIGKHEAGEIINSYATGSVEGERYVGGLVGYNSRGDITNSYAAGSVTGSSYVGGLVGYNRGNSITNSYWDKTTSGRSRSAGGVGKTTTKLQSPITPGSTSTEIYYSWSTNDWDFGTSVQYPALKYSDGTLMPNQRREPQIEIAGVPTGAVNEGESITMTASSASSASSIPLIYHWQQTSGKTLLINPTSGNTVILDVPEDYVAARTNIGDVVLTLRVSNDVDSNTHQVSITIAKRNNGGIAALGIPNLNERELTAPSIDSSGDPDGGGNNIGYQWQIRENTQTAWANVPAAGTNERYTIPADTTGIVQYRVVVSYTDGQGYEEEVMSEAVIYERIIVPQPSIDIASLTSCGTADIDQDDDGLIEICNLEGLNAIRHQLDGSGYRVSSSTVKITAGCAESGCKGYELEKDLDFNDDASYQDIANKTTWTTGAGWEPIGYYEFYNSVNNKSFKAIFEGNNYTISNLIIDRSNTRRVGLFSSIEGTIMNVGLLNVDINALSMVGGLAGYVTASDITNSYATGSVKGEEGFVGGLVAENSYSSITHSYAMGSATGNSGVGGVAGVNWHGTITHSYAMVAATGNEGVGGLTGVNWHSTITNSYAMGAATGNNDVGGLVGWNWGYINITNSYATGAVEGNDDVGGLVSYSSHGTITNTYWDKTTSGMLSSEGGVGKTTAELQSPIRPGSTSTEIYYGWSTNSWDFGTSVQYPALKYSDGTLMPNQRREIPEEPPQMPQIEIAGVPTGAVGEGERITLTASSTSSASSVPLIYQWQQTLGKTLLPNPTSGSRVTLDVPEDYVVASENTGNVVLILEASNDVGSTAQQVLITIAKSNNGGIAALGVPNLNERELTAPSIDLSGDPDGRGNNIRYQWQSRQSTQAAWINVPAAGTNERYTIPADTTGIVQYRVVVSYTDGQGYGEEVVSRAVLYERRVVPQPSIDIASLTSCGTADIDQDDDGLIEICNLEGLNAMRYQPDGSGYKVSASATRITVGCAEGGCKGYELEKDLDFNDDDSYSSTPNKVIWTTGEGWLPIGIIDMDSFSCEFKGNNHTISNLMINRPLSAYIGLFFMTDEEAIIDGVNLHKVDIVGRREVGSLVGVNERGTIRNIQLDRVSIKGSGSQVGGLVGMNEEGTIRNIQLHGDSSTTSTIVGTRNEVGGLVGMNAGGSVIDNVDLYKVSIKGRNQVGGLAGTNKGIIINSRVSGDSDAITNRVKGEGDIIGGLVGMNQRGRIINSHAVANVQGKKIIGVIIGQYVGGLVGYNTGQIINSYADGSVVAGGNVGGLIGKHEAGEIINSYATGSVEGERYVGGLVGLFGYNSRGDITNSYAAGSVTGSSYVGGLVGYNRGNSITNSYWDKTTSGRSRSAGGVGKTTTKLQSPITPGSTSTEIYYSWSTNDWDFGTSVQYPALKYSDGTLMPNQRREIPEEPAQMPQIEIVGVPTGAVDEGESITLTASSTSSASSIPLIYHWMQTSGGALFIEPTTLNRVTLDVPEDYVVASDNTGNVVLILEASNDVGSTAQQVLITIAKSNNGGIAALGVPSLNERELTAPSIDLSGDPDGVGNNIRYQWQSRQSAQAEWVNVQTAGTNERYIIPANTAGIVQYRVVVSYTDGQGYEEQIESGTSSYKGNTIPSVEIAGVPADAVDEGEQITLTAFPHNSDNNILPSYSWTQTSGKTLLISPTSGSRVTLDVPEDYVVASENTGNVVLILEASNDVGSTAQQVLITIAKRNNGGIAALGVPNLNERELTAPSIDLSGDPDGSGSNIRYQWQSRQNPQTEWVNVQTAGTNALYTIPADTAGVVAYRVAVSYTDGQGYEEQIESGTSSYRSNTSPSIELPGSDSYIRLMAGQTTAVSVVISEVDVSDVVTLTIESASTTGIIHVEPSRIVLDASLSETRTTQFQLTAEQVGSAKLLLTAVDDSQTVTDSSDAVELTVEIEAAPFTPCGFADIDRDNDGLIEICNLEGLNAMRNQMFGTSYKENTLAPEITTGCAEGGCKGYELVKDLDFNDEGSYKDIANKAIWTTGEGWQPIGVHGNGFSSIFEGNNNTISNLMIDRSFADNVGLFGIVDGQSKINGIRLLDVDINAQSRVGGLAGHITSGDITNSSVTGNVIGQLTVGGLVGRCSDSRVSNSYAIGRVEAMGTIGGIDAGSSSAVGGLVGYLLNSSVSRSHAIGSVKGVGGYAGGLIGSNAGRNGSIITSYAFVEVEGGSNYTGGLVGSNNGINNKISNSYSIGKVTGENAVGGLVGRNRSRNTITNSYSFSNVKGSSQVGSLVGNNVGTITNSYAVGRVAGNVEQSDIGGLVGAGVAGGATNSYWDKTTSGRATSVGGIGQTTAQLQVPTVSGSTSTEVYHGWSEEIWDFGTSKQYPALKYSDGTLMPDQRIGLLSLSVLTTEEVSFIFNTEVFDYRLLIDSEADAVQLLPTATRADANINIVSDSDFSESVASGNLSPAIPLNTTGTTLVTIEVEFVSGANRVYHITISRAEQSSPAQLVGVNAPFEHTIPMSVMMDSDNNMREYEVVSMPSWLERIELEEGIMFSGTPEMDHMDTPSEHTIEIRIDNGDGTTQMLSLVLQIDSPTTGTIKLIALPDGILQLDDQLKDDNGIEKKIYIWEHCPVGGSTFRELEGVNGMSYELPSEGLYVEAGTAYRVRTTVVDSLGQRSEYMTQIELPERAPPKPVIRIRAKIFLEVFLK